jgi:hypothetical protein
VKSDENDWKRKEKKSASLQEQTNLKVSECEIETVIDDITVFNRKLKGVAIVKLMGLLRVCFFSKSALKQMISS